MIKVAVIIAITLATVLSMNMMAIEENFANANTDAIIPQTQKVNNLQISNYTGSGITPEMVSVFIKVINDAYTFYRDNTTQNCQYIQSKLQGSYSNKFQVLIFTENSTADRRVYASSSGGAYVAWSKVNTAKPLWSYIIIALSSISLTKTQILGLFQRGSGMSLSLQKVLQNTIARYETGKNCSCNTFMVQNDLQTFDGQRWNVVCSSPKVNNIGFSGIIYQKDYIYEQTLELTSGRCRYLAWVI